MSFVLILSLMTSSGGRHISWHDDPRLVATATMARLARRRWWFWSWVVVSTGSMYLDMEAAVD